jgi:hypothetical protein
MTVLDLTGTAKKLGYETEKLYAFLSGDGLFNLLEALVNIEQIAHDGDGGDCREIEGIVQQILAGLK